MVKGQGHRYLKTVKLFKIQLSSNLLTKGVHIRHNVCISHVDCNTSHRIYIYDLEVKSESNVS